MERSARAARRSLGLEADFALRALECCALGEFSAEAGERVAGVVQRHRGELSATALLSLDPEDALFCVRQVGVGDPLEQFVALGRGVLEEIVSALAEAFEAASQPGQARLVEESIVAIVLATHAPSDTLILGAGLDVSVAGRCLPARLHLLLEPKLFETLSAGCARGAPDPVPAPNP